MGIWGWTWRSVWVWRIVTGLLLAGWGGWAAWHLAADHAAVHRMIGHWNTYGPLLERAHRAEQAPRPGPPTPTKE